MCNEDASRPDRFQASCRKRVSGSADCSVGGQVRLSAQEDEAD